MRSLRGWLVVVLALGALAGLGPPAVATETDKDRVVLIGVPGLRWGDVRPHATPELWRLAGQGGIANIAVRGVAPNTCAAEGWLTISAGGRARPIKDGCVQPPKVEQDGPGAVVEGHSELRAHNKATTYASQVGLLGDAVHRSGGCTAAAGPGGALAAADFEGRVDHYTRNLPTSRWKGWKRCPVTVVDVDNLARQDNTTRAAALTKADRSIADLVERAPEGARILIVGVADVGHSGLRVTIDTGAPGYLTGPSTRRTGLITLTDVTPTVLRQAGVPVPQQLTGAAWTHQKRDAASITQLREKDLAARIARDLVAPFNIALVGGQLLAYALAALAWRRSGPNQRQRVANVTRIIALAAASAPAATYLANLIPWWRVEHPAAGLTAAILLADLAVLATALAWRRRKYGPVIAVAAITSVTLAADAITGSGLQADSLNGNFSLAAGRFYGFGNLTFALFATASLICAAGLAETVERRRWAVALAVLVGGAAIMVDGWPGWGSDVGGVLALTPGVVLLALGTAGRRPSVRPVLLAGAAGAVAVAALAYLDARRPTEQRSHLGEFWHSALDGGAWPILERKADSMLNSLGGGAWVTLPVTLALVLLMAALVKVLGDRFRDAPALKAAPPAVLVTAVVGFAVNDSGIAVPALTALIAVPLLLAAALSGGHTQRT